jgi:uncharacterized protein (TIGR02246 family)
MRARTLLLLSAVPVLAAACARSEDAATTTSESAAGVAATAATDPNAARQAIDAANARFVEAAKQGDTTVIGTLFAEDAVVMMSNQPAARGIEGARKTFGAMFAPGTVKDFSLKTEDVAVGGDLAVETGTYEMTMQPPGGREAKDKGKYVTVWKRQADGSWKIIRDIGNSDLPMPR